MLYVTSYNVNGDEYHTTLYARDEEHLHQLIAQRGMGEKAMEGVNFGAPSFVSDDLRTWYFSAAQHAACWLAMVAIKSGVFSGWDLLNDHGLVHMVSHLLPFRQLDKATIDDKQRLLIATAYEMALFVESRTPGFTRCAHDFVPVSYHWDNEPMEDIIAQARTAHPEAYERFDKRIARLSDVR